MVNTFNVGKQALVLREIADETFDGSSDLRCGQSAHLSYDSELSAYSPLPQRTIVFLPMSTTPWTSPSPLRLLRILCIC